MSKKHKTYTTEFKAEAIKLIEANQGNVSETARQLSISMQTLSNWNTEPYRVCRRVNILRDYPDDKIKIYP